MKHSNRLKLVVSNNIDKKRKMVKQKYKNVKISQFSLEGWTKPIKQITL